MRSVDLYEGGYDLVVTVAQGIDILPYSSGLYAGRWALCHACPGTHRDLGDPVYIVAPIINSDLVSIDPLTFTPSILCMGAANPCGLHGFITDGVWHDAGTPPETMAYIQAASRSEGGDDGNDPA